MKGSGAKIFIFLIAVVGVVAIAWYLIAGDQDMSDATTATDNSVKVETAPEQETPTETTTEAPAETVDTTAAPTQTPAELPNSELAGLSDAAISERYEALPEVERAAFVTDFVEAAGENRSVEASQNFIRGPVEARKNALGFAIAQTTAEEYDSRRASYIAGFMLAQGTGTEQDLVAATRYLRHEGLLDTPNALYWRARILIDPDYPNPDREAAMNLLKKMIRLGDPENATVKEAQALLEELQAG